MTDAAFVSAVLGRLRGRLIVSCQPVVGGPLDRDEIVVALAEAVNDGRVKAGDLVLLEAMGGGLTWGAALVRW